MAVRRDENVLGNYVAGNYVVRNYVAGNYVAGNYVMEVCGNLHPCEFAVKMVRGQWLPGVVRRHRL